MSASEAPPTPRSVDAVVVGAGFSGMYLLHQLREQGLSVVVFEAGTDVGGTWYWNRYPGARVDVESLAYSYSFSPDLEQEYQWEERYPTQPEILKYARHVADRFDLRRDIVFRTRVTAATWDEEAGTWLVRTEHGDAVSARFFVMATGCLSASKMPEIPGLETFKGATYHTAHWPHEGVDFTGKRVALIGTGSSGVQSIRSSPSRPRT
ncbi:NAD(P)/FAD-dependent oxidoreductase [Actinoplanes sp. NPDC048967]|uniref:flavin-containing monooxygenase n=1 Tax=Actinoplanes sp. NPDC048967 TaxID=3155269 RepID=UPI0034104716